MERAYWVYIFASGLGSTLYIGVTNDLVRRIYEHRMGFADGFTKKYRVHRLVYFESYGDVEAAIRREKQLKNGTGPGRYGSLRRKIRIEMICTPKLRCPEPLGRRVREPSWVPAKAGIRWSQAHVFDRSVGDYWVIRLRG